MLLATKKEVESISALLVEGAETPDDLAKIVIRRLSELREERKTFALVFGLGPGVHAGFGPFTTRDAAFNSVDKNPVAHIASRAAVVPIIGSSRTADMLALADAPPTERGEFAVIREDVKARRNGWDGKERSKQRFLMA